MEWTVVSPTRDPKRLSAHEIPVPLEQDHARVCLEGTWITEGLCRSYQPMLAALTTALEQERRTEAQDRLAELLGDLEETWSGPSRAPEPDAYWLLRTNLEAIQARMER